MNRMRFLIPALSLLPLSLLAEKVRPSLAAEAWRVAERSAQANAWESVTLATNAVGEVRARRHRYQEIGTGLNFWRPDENLPAGGAWQPTVEGWQATAEGLAALQGPHQVVVANNVSLGNCVQIIGAQGTRLLGNPVAIGVFDPVDGKHAILAKVIEVAPQWGAEASQIVFPQCFDEIKASLRYTYRKHGFSQEVILEEAFALPEGFSAQSRMECYSEFDFTTPLPVKSARVLRAETGFADETLEWGDLRMGEGRAFALGEGGGANGIPVGKSYQIMDGRPVLIEAVEWSALQPLLEKLQAAKAPKPENKAVVVQPGRKLPPVAARVPLPRLPLTGEPKELAQYQFNDRAVVIDYEVLSGVNTTTYTFKGDSTYLVSGPFHVTNAVLEGGAVIKFTNNTSAKIIVDALECKGSFYNPAIFTSFSDNVVGEWINGSTGNPTTNYCGESGLKTTQTNAANYAHLRFSYLKTGFYADTGSSVSLSHVQFNGCEVAVKQAAGVTVPIYNGLFYNTKTNFSGGTVRGEHLTLHQIDYFGTNCAVYLTNSLIIAVANTGEAMTISSNFCQSSNLASGVFTNVGAGRSYLVDPAPAGYRDAGTTAINATLLSELRRLTTEAPMVVSNVLISTSTNWSPVVARDTNDLDLGYHYPPIDVAMSQVIVSNATLTLTNGVAVASFGANIGLMLKRESSLVSEGTPMNLNRLVRYQSVQEDSLFWGGTNAGTVVTENSLVNWSMISARFTQWATPSLRWPNHLIVTSATNTVLRDCQWHNGWLAWQQDISSVPMRLGLTNNLLDRTSVGLSSHIDPDYPACHVQVRNNLFFGGGEIAFNNEQAFDDPGDALDWVVQDNVLDQPVFLIPTHVTTNSHNCYIGTAVMDGSLGNDITNLTSFPYASGPLGNYYQASTNLIDQGSQTAAAAGLAHHTTQTNQSKEATSPVDIGFHYVALSPQPSTLNQPFDTDGDGLADHAEDLNGNGAKDAGETDWTNPDTDQDGRSDAQELAEGTDPQDPDDAIPARLAQWNFELLSENQIATGHGTSNQAPVLSNNLAFAEGILFSNKAVQFTGGAAQLAYRETETNGSKNFTLRQGSLRCWFQPLASPGAAARLWEVGTKGDTTNGYWTAYRTSTEVVFASHNGTNGGVNLTAGASLAVGEWQHLVLTWSSNACAWWVNGVLAGSANTTLYFPKAVVRTNGFHLGSDENGGNPAQGKFDSWETFNYPLSESEITNHYAYTKPWARVPRLMTWLDAGQPIGFFTNGNASIVITNWTDQVGDYDFLQTESHPLYAARRPGWVSSEASANGQAVVRFDGVTNYLQSWVSLPTTWNEVECLTVLRSTRPANQTNGFWRLGNTAISYYPRPDGTIKDTFAAQSTAFDTGVPVDPDLLRRFHLYDARMKISNTWDCRLNGLLHYANRAGGFSGSLGYQTRLGQNGDAVDTLNSYFQGDIAEILIYTNGLTTADRFALGAHLNYKYRLLTNAPNAPTNLRVQAVSPTQVMLTWEGMPTNHSLTYVVERRAGRSGQSIQVRLVVDATSCFDTGLTTGTTYYYRLKAVNYWSESTVVEANVNTLNGGQADLPQTNLVVWLRADAGIVRQTTSNTVAVWQDQARTNDATQVGPSHTMGRRQPQHLPAQANGHPAVGFNLPGQTNGTNYLLLGGDQKFPLASLTEGEIWVVLKSINTNNNGFWNFGYLKYDTWFPTNQNKIWDNFGSSNLVHKTTLSASNVLTNYYLYRVKAAASMWTNWYNETPLFFEANTVRFPMGGTGVEARIGSSANMVVPFQGHMQELLLFSPALSNGQADTVKNYLRKKYALWE